MLQCSLNLGEANNILGSLRYAKTFYTHYPISLPQKQVILSLQCSYSLAFSPVIIVSPFLTPLLAPALNVKRPWLSPSSFFLWLCGDLTQPFGFTFHLYAEDSQGDNSNPPGHLCSRLIHLTWSLTGSLASMYLFILFSFCSPLYAQDHHLFFEPTIYSHLMVFAPILPSAWKMVPPVFAWLPHSAFRAPPLEDLLWPCHLNQPLL